MIKHFSKWLELVSLLNHSSEGAVYAFLDRVLCRFDALIKVLIDQGIKFHGDFQELCEEALIDHQTASRDHLEAKMLVE